MLERFIQWIVTAVGATARRSRLHEPQPGIKIDQLNDTFRDSLVAYDENLLERTKTQWRFGDWESLTAIPIETLKQHPDSAKLALYCAAGHQARGRSEDAMFFSRLAFDLGCNRKLMTQVLISGVYNTLGGISALSKQDTRALNHFETALKVGENGNDTALLTRARVTYQLGKFGLPVNTSSVLSFQNDKDNVLKNDVNNNQSKIFFATVKAQHNLGMAWAGNTINTVIFRHHGVITHKGVQYTAFYVNLKTLRLVKRNLSNEAVQTYDLYGDYNLWDAHNSISLAVDRADHLHISYDHHSSKLRYRRSLEPMEIKAWTEECPMTGKNEERVTYPTFILPRTEYPLTMLYRDGASNNGRALLKTFDEASQNWTDHPQPVITGAGQKPWTSNAYWNHPVVDSKGHLHLSFVWRTHSLGQEKIVNNVNICYALSEDNGLTWRTSLGRECQLPMTPVNAETIHAVSPGSNLINQCSMAVDSKCFPHIAFYSNDQNGIPQYQHLRFDGKRWHHQIISERSQYFSLAGGGTLQTLMSRPEIIVDVNDNAYIIYRGDISQDRLVATKLDFPNYVWLSENTRILWPDNIGYAEPIIDRQRWNDENILSILIQANDQPPHDIDHKEQQRQVDLVDVILH